MSRQTLVVPHDPAWAEEYQGESARIKAALGDALIKVHHIGSTAIPDIHAKPIIDILGEAGALTGIDARISDMAELGYEAMGEFGIPGRRYFRKDNTNGARTHHVHVFGTGDVEIARHLAFREYLIAHPTVAREYSELKCRLVASCEGAIERYMAGKDAFIKDVDRRAQVWLTGSDTSR